jgi:molecular chaperone DnaK (HSP70)
VPSRYLIGIDLGTTNSVVAYIDIQDAGGAGSAIRVFPIPQLAAHGEVRTIPALPSFLYFPTEDELSAGAVSATWDEKPPMVTGVLAREQGALVPSRQVSSAKSWLSYAGVNRRANILPAQAEPSQPMVSPVEASARYLMHMRDAWNGALGTTGETRFERQEIVLTVPASFDEEARELTVEAARRAGLHNLTLLEEPLAAFYAWMAAREERSPVRGDRRGGGYELRDGELILICDIGGGTTDFSMVRARVMEGELQFERTAIGEHLLLGGDNLDLALAHRVEQKIGAKLKDGKLTLRQRYALRLACCAAKERLLSDASVGQVPITILGSGRAVIGQTLSVELARAEVLEILIDGFLPLTAPDAMPAQERASVSRGLRELGLPYAGDPAITRHLAAFLTQAAVTMNATTAGTNAALAAGGPSPEKPRMVRPDAVLFNGGFCTPAVTRERIIEAISAWFSGAENGWRPKLLDNDAVESAVACGAAHYGRVRRGAGARIRAGSARTYYIGSRSEGGLEGICVLPTGTEEGATLPAVNREFSVLANRPVSFTLYSSRMRYDAPGEVVVLDEATVHRHAPLVTLLRYGKKLREVQLVVRLRTRFTELGTLEIWCESRETPHRWRLQFELRGDAKAEQEALDEAEAGQQEAQAPQSAMAEREAAAAQRCLINAPFDATVEAVVQMMRGVFSSASQASALREDGDVAPDSLIGRMESALEAKRDSWPVLAIRRFGDALIDVAAGRKTSPRHEVRWLNLSGFCLRPGFGAPGDEARVRELRTIAANELAFADDLQCQVERLVLLRRIAGGINASDQQALYRKYAIPVCMNKPGVKKGRVNRQLESEAWRLAASLEHLPANSRVSLGNELLAKIKKEPQDGISLWSIGRLGTRIPLYGPLHSVVAPEIAGEWVKTLIQVSLFTAAAAAAIAMMARRTDDRARDIDEGIREQTIQRLQAFRIGQEIVESLSKCVAPGRADAVRSFGESLPPGLEVVGSSNCLLSLPALHSAIGP